MNGLALKTEKIFESISKLECIKPYILVGGTALSLQLNHRKSEDLDFMRWRSSKNEKMEVSWSSIEKQLSKIGEVQKVDILDIDHVEYQVSGVKLSFYACDKYSPINMPIDFLNNIKLSGLEGIMASKMETLMRRSTFRDYYDIYSMLKYGIDIDASIKAATVYSGHKLSTKNLLSMLTNGERFQREKSFAELNPIYNVDSKDIECYIKECLNRKIKFTAAVEKGDFSKLSELKEQGYRPTKEMIQSLSPNIKMQIVVEKLFNLPNNIQGLDNIKLAKDNTPILGENNKDLNI